MSDDYGSGDELFDDVDANQLISEEPPARPSHKRSLTETSFDDSLFDGVNVDVLLSSQAAPETRGDNNKNSNATAKRQRREHSNGGGGGLRTNETPNKAHLALARRLLAEKFGYESFRHEQQAAIANVLGGRNTLVIFPTGAGKSLCYQIPGIAFEALDLEEGTREAGEHGITIVVSPLIALMKDQVDALRRRGIAAECMDSTKTWEEQQLITLAMRKGQLRLLYCAPERLNNEGFVETIKNVRGGVRLIAVDEAHCVSEWGHSFRPEYLKVARFATEINAERVICLTATATPKVAEDIQNAFDIAPDSVFRTSPYRPNLNLYVKAVGSKLAKYPLLFKFLKENRGPALVYVTLQQQAELLADDLRTQGFDARPFHAGMKVEEKKKIQDDFMENRVRIVVATIAFGMGIDKPDIRSILHFDLPSTVEEYSQQVGRAGRDGMTSNCMFYICRDDWYLRENFARGDLPSKNSLRGLLKNIFRADVACLPVDGIFKTSHYEQTRAFDIRMSPLGTIYAALELRFGLIRAITPEYSEYKFIPSVSYFPRMRDDTSRAGKAIFQHAMPPPRGGQYRNVDIGAIMSATGGSLPRTDLIRKLNELHDTGVIELKAGGVEPRYRVLTAPLPATDAAIDELTDELHADLERREADSLRRTREVEDLVTGDTCFALALARHFGMGLPGGRTACGHCTRCRTGMRVVVPEAPARALDVDGIRAVLNACPARDDPRFLARIAFGIKSPRVTQMRMDKDAVFGILADHDFMSLLREFTNACRTAGFVEATVQPRTPAQPKPRTQQARTQRGGRTQRAGRGGRGGYRGRW